MSGPAEDDFDLFCAQHNIQPGEEAAAFAAWLNEISDGEWDGDVNQVSPSEPPDPEKG